MCCNRMGLNGRESENKRGLEKRRRVTFLPSRSLVSLPTAAAAASCPWQRRCTAATPSCDASRRFSSRSMTSTDSAKTSSSRYAKTPFAKSWRRPWGPLRGPWQASRTFSSSVCAATMACCGHRRIPLTSSGGIPVLFTATPLPPIPLSTETIPRRVPFTPMPGITTGGWTAEIAANGRSVTQCLPLRRSVPTVAGWGASPG